MHRRTLLAGIGVGCGFGLTGCLGDDLTSFSATSAGVADSVRSETGYSGVGVEERRNERTFEFAGQSETVVVTSMLTEYEKTLDMGALGEQESAIFSVLSTPKVEILGRSFNPVEDMSTEELVDLIAENYDDIGDLEHREDRTAQVIGQEVTESQFVAEASLNGQPFDLLLHVTEAAERGDDFVVAIGAYPELFEREEQPNVQALIEAITPADDESDDEVGDGENDGADGENDGADGENDGTDSDNDDANEESDEADGDDGDDEDGTDDGDDNAADGDGTEDDGTDDDDGDNGDDETDNGGLL